MEIRLTLKQRLKRWVWSRIMLVLRGMTLGSQTIALNDEGHVLMVRHGYREGWYLPGGGVDHGETMEEAARRELEEETGHHVDGPLTFVGIFYNRHQWKGDHVALYVAQSITKVRDVEPSFEIKEVDFFPLDHLPDNTTQGARDRLAEWQAGSPPSALWT